MALDRLHLITSFGSPRCPACRGHKFGGHTFCKKCYQQLPERARDRLARHLGHGYEEAVAEALVLLEVAVPFWTQFQYAADGGA